MTNTHQRGIAIAPILFVVAILAVLASAIAAGSGAFNGDTSAVKLKAQATAILGYVDELKIGVDRVLSRCPDTEISLANSVDSGYAENPLAPADKSCHVFDVNGGGVLFKEPPADVDLTEVPETLRHYFIHTRNEIFFFGQTVIYNFSSGQTVGRELIIVLPGIKKELCLKINDMVGVALEGGDVPTRPFTNLATNKVWNYWTISNGMHLGCGTDASNFNKPSCCIEIQNNSTTPSMPNGSYAFFHVLHTR